MITLLPMPVVFCVGLARTGTTTFGDACESLGFTRSGWEERQNCHPSLQRIKAWKRGDIDYLVDVASGYDVLEDLPWPLVYREMAEAFPDAKFALTRRRTAQKWLESQTAHMETLTAPGMYRRIFGSGRPAENPDLYLAHYERHLREVRAHFSSTERFAEFCWEEGDGWPQLCDFLGVPVPETQFPHSNPAGWTPPPPSKLRLLGHKLIRVPTSAISSRIRGQSPGPSQRQNATAQPPESAA